MIEVKHLTKRYGDFTAVSDLSFTIAPGKIYGFLGPNSAGKSTTMNIITGCLAATEGQVRIGGFDVFEQPRQAKRLVGYLPEQPPVYMEQTVEEYLHFVARAKGLHGEDIHREIDKAIEQTHIEDVAHKRIRNLSKGYRQRVGIAQALVGSPEVIILDEPTVGLDPAQTIEMRELVRALGQEHTVIISSHILPEIQAMCEEVLIIHRGRLVAFDRLENLALSAGNSVELEAQCGEAELRSLLAQVDGITDVHITAQKDGAVSAILSVGEEEPRAVCGRLFRCFARSDAVLLRLNPEKATLEDVFIRITRQQTEQEGGEDEPCLQ